VVRRDEDRHLRPLRRQQGPDLPNQRSEGLVHGVWVPVNMMRERIREVKDRGER